MRARLGQAWLVPLCSVLALARCGADEHPPRDAARDASADVARDAPDAAPDAASDAPDAVSDAPDGEASASDAPDGDAPGDVVDASGDVEPDAPYFGPRFTEVALAAGLDYRQVTTLDCALSPDVPCELLAMSGGAAASDYDRDGHVDLFVTRLDGAGILYRGRGDGTFVDVTASAGLGADVHGNGALWGDVDGDADLDLWVTTFGPVRYYLYVNRGDGTFAEEAVARGLAVVDALPHQGYGATLGDYDGDGYLDAFVGEWRPYAKSAWIGQSSARLLHNRGASEPGVFDDVTVAAGVALTGLAPNGVFGWAPAFADLDRDGYLDLAIAGDFGTSRLFWGGASGFSDGTALAGVGTDENGMGSAFGDFDGDGRLDWFVTSIYDTDYDGPYWGSSGNRLWRYAGARSFSDVTDVAGVRNGGWGWGAAGFDYDLDGDLDLVMTNGVIRPEQPKALEFASDPMRLWQNDGATFREVAQAAGMTSTLAGKGLLVLDIDEDGDLDVFVANEGERPSLYRNDAPPGSWLRVLPRDGLGRDAINARVEVQKSTGDAPLVRELLLTAGFLGQSDPALHFGLGGVSTPLSRVTVTYADGATRTLTDVAPNQTLIVTP